MNSVSTAADFFFLNHNYKMVYVINFILEDPKLILQNSICKL